MQPLRRFQQLPLKLPNYEKLSSQSVLEVCKGLVSSSYRLPTGFDRTQFAETENSVNPMRG
jgi:hypothetical protein